MPHVAATSASNPNIGPTTDVPSSPGPGPPDVPPPAAPTTPARGVSLDPGLSLGESATTAIGRGVAVLVGAFVGALVGAFVGAFVGLGVGFGVGFAAAFAVGLGVGLGVDLGMAVGFGVGAAVGFGVGIGVGVGVGVGGGGGGGAVTTTRDGLTFVWSQVAPPAVRARKRYPHDPIGSSRVPVKSTPPAQSEPVGARSDQVPWTLTRTQVGAVPVVSETVTANVKVVVGVPVPGETVPPAIVIGPQVRANAGDANPIRDVVSQPASANAPTSQVRRSRRLVFGSKLPSYWSDRT
jgi:hypothetical protein